MCRSVSSLKDEASNTLQNWHGDEINAVHIQCLALQFNKYLLAIFLSQNWDQNCWEAGAQNSAPSISPGQLGILGNHFPCLGLSFIPDHGLSEKKLWLPPAGRTRQGRRDGTNVSSVSYQCCPQVSSSRQTWVQILLYRFTDLDKWLIILASGFSSGKWSNDSCFTGLLL